MMFRILAFLLLPVICLAQVNSKVEKPTGELLSNEISPNEINRNASFNLDEIKVRWKKAALENCTGVPCVIAPSFTCGTSTVSDIDNNVYNTVFIGTQCWTKENLKVTKYNDNTAIPLNATGGPSGTSISWSVTTGVYTIYGNQLSTEANATNYGFVYNWYAATDSRKICPTGWHVPTDSDWNKLVKFTHSGNPAADTSSTSTTQSTTAGTKLKKNDNLWTTNSGTNDFGFSALPGGFRAVDGSFSGIRDNAFFWSATEYDTNYAWYRALFSIVGIVNRSSSGNKSFGASVRCLRD
ncbi:hypothetical protein LBMAG24_24750 [Bacteroidota bacterium]|nr:hypothetical protein LBMAG24_24750 [Bacteroidota bacterium]